MPVLVGQACFDVSLSQKERGITVGGNIEKEPISVG
jgi:hypothetical protein